MSHNSNKKRPCLHRHILMSVYTEHHLIWCCIFKKHCFQAN